MCGIAGYFGKKDIDVSKIKQCQILMKRRGPNHCDYILSKKTNNLVLIHSRLSIIDLGSGSNQPFKNNIGDVLSFNGEIYNYKEIKKKLENRNIDFKTLGDTEVLFKLIKNMGMSSVEDCEGMWAFVFYDKEKEKIFLSRDRFGEKPLFYFEDNDGIYFGSEPKFIFSLLGRKLPINYSHIKRYLINGYKSIFKEKDNFFDGLKRVEPSSYYEIDKNLVLKKNKYWEPKFDFFNKRLTEFEIISKSYELLKKSVELRLRSDVPIAFCLSGGVDSVSLISIACKEFDYKVHGFSIINEDKRYEELDMINYAKKTLKLKHTKKTLRNDNFFANLKKQICYHDSPILTISYYAQWRLMKEISNQGYKVSISGTGADEIYTGYYDHHNAFLCYMKKFKKDEYAKCLKDWENKVKKYIRNPFLRNDKHFIEDINERRHIYLNINKFKEYLIGEFNEDFYEFKYSNILLRNRMSNEMFNETVPQILHQDDLNSMYYSVENRSPFLDKDLYEFLLQVPTEFLIKNGYGKYILRESVKKIAPSKIINNPRKVGFNMPLENFVNFNEKKTEKILLQDSPIFEIIDRKKIKNSFSDKLTNSESKFLFNFINAKFFMEAYS